MKKILKYLVIGLVLMLTSCVDAEIEEFTIFYIDYDGTEIQSTKYVVGDAIEEPSHPTRVGYTFIGWDTELPDVMIANDITFNAVYDINSYNVSFIDYDGDLIETFEVEYGVDITFETPTDFTRTGYSFDGWDGELPSTMPAENLTYQATYMIDQFTISFDTDQGSDITAITQDYGSTIIAPTDPVREDCIFLGWYTSPLFTSTYDFTTMPSKDTTVYAKWSFGFSDDINDFVEDLGFNGSILVYFDDETLHNEGYGWANIGDEIENTPDTRFLIGSITKQFTAVAIMMLYEDGLLSVDDTVDMYIPDFPNGDIITVHHLLTHTSGLENYLIHIPRDDEYLRSYHSPLSLINLIRNFPLEFTPGEEFEYSNTNYVILGHIIEILSGVTYQEYMQTNIFTPLGLDNTGFSALEPGPNDALGYEEIINSGSLPRVLRHPSISFSSGSMISTTGDLLIWHHALMDNILITQATTDLMYTPYTGPSSMYFDGYGYGWNVQLLFGDVKLFHSGDSQYFTTYYYRNATTDLAVIITSNEYVDLMDLILFYIFDELDLYGY